MLAMQCRTPQVIRAAAAALLFTSLSLGSPVSAAPGNAPALGPHC